ncbi:uncharacterized protein E5676_scaffold461G00200 [Cucumis melo var. makuwa]|uniref:Uncharacterized protein n=1 Tax=Cucumis melo var. makuwa TaxID=1194695 RepID=A0A5D3CSP3_CUCMM|nr:uncharacterized protein E5676_scaffold461G00200 [Cucumis melo var. makuwa]
MHLPLALQLLRTEMIGLSLWSPCGCTADGVHRWLAARILYKKLMSSKCKCQTEAHEEDGDNEYRPLTLQDNKDVRKNKEVESIRRDEERVKASNIKLQSDIPSFFVDGRLKKKGDKKQLEIFLDILKQLHNNLLFVDALEQMPLMNIPSDVENYNAIESLGRMLLTMLKHHKKVIGWTLVDVEGINPSSMHKIRLEGGQANCTRRPTQNYVYMFYGTFAFRNMPFGLCNAPGTFQRMFEQFGRSVEEMRRDTTRFELEEVSLHGN